MEKYTEKQRLPADTSGNHPEHQEALPENPVEAPEPLTGDEVGTSMWDQSSEATSSIRRALTLTPSGRILHEDEAVTEALQVYVGQLSDALIRKCEQDEMIMIIALQHVRLDTLNQNAAAVLTIYHVLTFVDVGSKIDEQEYKVRYLRQAAELAGVARALIPDSMAVAQFHTSVLHLAGADPEEVARSCESALAIKNPNDLAWLARGELTEEMTRAERVRFFRQRVEKLLAEMRIVQAEKAVPITSRPPTPTTPRGARMTKRRLQRIATAEVEQYLSRKYKAKAFWKENLNREQKKCFFHVEISGLLGDLKYFHDDDRELQEVRNALAFIETHRSLRGWSCSLCKEVLPLTEDFSPSTHLESRHGELIQQSLLTFLVPLEVELGYADVIKEEFEKGLNASVEIADTLGDAQERSNLLSKIQFTLYMLAKNRSLYKSHLVKVLNFAEEEFKTCSSDVLSPDLITTTLESPLQCVCFLRTSQLNKIQSFLNQLLRLFFKKEPRSSPVEDPKQAAPPDVLLDPESPSFRLDESHFLSDANKFDVDSFISWLYPSTDNIMAEVLAWREQQDRRIQSGVEAVVKIKDTHLDLFSSTNKKFAIIKELQSEYGKEVNCYDTCEDNCWTLRDYRDKSEGSTRKNTLIMQLLEVDANMIKHNDVVQDLVKRIQEGHISDYKVMLLPLLKAYLQKCLDELVQKYARHKSDVAAESLLALPSSEEDQKKGKQEKRKEKKKTGKSKKPKAKKALTDDSDSPGELSVEVSPASAGICIGSALEHSKDGAKEDDELNEMRLLERNLEYQLKIEDEFKQSHCVRKEEKDSD